MACERCGGFIVAEQLREHLAAGSSGKLEAMRCLNCGNLEDAVIRANRVGPRGRGRTARVAFGSRMGNAARLIAGYLHGHATSASEGASSTTHMGLESAHPAQRESLARNLRRSA